MAATGREVEPGEGAVAVDRAEAFSRFRDVIVEVLDVAPDQVVPEARWADLDADSLAVTEISLALDEAFSIKIPEVDPEDMATVGMAFDLVADLFAAQASGA